MKIDTSKIEGYADMTAEERLAALEGFEFDDQSGEIQKLKDAVSKANSEAASYKKKLREKMDGDEAKAAQEAEEREAMQRELDTLRKEKAISSYQAKFLGLGYDAESAAAAAKALQEGDFDSVFASQEKFIEATKKEAVSGSLKKQPGLTGGNPVGKENIQDSTVDAFRKAALGS